MESHKKFGLAGYPAAHSISPKLFEAAYAGAYPYDIIEEPEFSAVLKRFMDEGYCGINVTAPFKNEAYKCSDIHDSSAERVSAANILIRTNEGIKAYNSDYLGLKMIITDHFEIGAESDDEERIKALVIGCGGAGQAAACAAYDCGLEVTIANRTISKAEKFIAEKGLEGTFACALDDIRENIKDSSLIIYTLPESIREIAELPKKMFRGKSILEASYSNPTFSKGAGHRNLPQRSFYISGKIWLLSQALTGYEILTGQKPDEQAMLDIIK